MINNGYSYYLGYFSNGLYLIDIYDEIISITANHPLEKLCGFINRFDNEKSLNEYLITMGYIAEEKNIIIIEKRGDSFKELPGPLIFKPHKDLLTMKGLEKGSKKFLKNTDFYFWGLNYLNDLKKLPFSTIPDINNYTSLLSRELAYCKKVLKSPKYGYKGRLKDMTKTMREVFEGAIFSNYLDDDNISFRRIYDIASLLLKYVSDTVKYDEIINQSIINENEKRVIDSIKKRYQTERFSDFTITFGSLIYNVYYERFKNHFLLTEDYMEEDKVSLEEKNEEIRLF